MPMVMEFPKMRRLIMLSNLKLPRIAAADMPRYVSSLVRDRAHSANDGFFSSAFAIAMDTRPM